MTTVIAVYNSEGCVGRCDAHCHDARTSTCTCVCGGRLHGVGRHQAVAENTWQLLGNGYQAAQNAERWAAARGVDVAGVRVVRSDSHPAPAAEQLELAR